MFFFVRIVIIYSYYKWFDKRILKGALILMEEQGQPGEMNTVAEYNVLFDSVDYHGFFFERRQFLHDISDP